MRILSLVVAGVLALSLSGPPTWASPAGAGNPPAKSDPAKRVEKPKPAAKPKPGTPSKSGEVSLGSAARRELLKHRLQGASKTAKGKPALVKKKS